MNIKHILLLITLLISHPLFAVESNITIIKLLEKGLLESKNKNYESAINTYKAAAKLGSAQAYSRLSSIYARGHGVEINKKLSDEYLQKAIRINTSLAENGDFKAQFHLGYIYYRMQVNKELSYKWLKLAATNDNVNAQFLFAYLLKKGFFKALSPDGNEESIIWFTAAAKQGHSKASYELASRAYKDPKSLNTVLKWCVPLVKKGDKKCQKLVTIATGRGLAFKKYKQISFDAITELAESNVTHYQVTLGLLFKEGKFIDADSEKSDYWFNRAFNNLLIEAKAGDGESQNLLATLYTKGYGTDKNIEEAIYWLKKSSQQGNKQAKKHLTKINKVPNK